MTPFIPAGSSVASHGKPGSGVTVSFTAFAFSLDVQVTFMKRAACVQQVSCANVTSGGFAAPLPDGEVTPPGPSPPRPNRNPPTAIANTSATTTTLIWPIRSARVYIVGNILASRGSPAYRSDPARPHGSPCARACLKERYEPRARALRPRDGAEPPRGRHDGSGR